MNAIKEIVESFLKDRYVQLVIDPNNKVFASFMGNGGNRLFLAVEDQSFKDHLCMYLICKDLEISKGKVESLVERIRALGLSSDVRSNLPVRLEAINKDGFGEILVLDLGRNDNKCVYIDQNGWDFFDNHEIYFYRPSKQVPQIEPLKEVNIQNFLNTFKGLWNFSSPNDYLLLLAQILFFYKKSLGGDTTIPMALFIGEQGSGKSTAAKWMKSLIDPTNKELLIYPRSLDDIYVLAKNSHVIAFDNVSFIPNDHADIFCAMATGVGYTKRKLYTDSEEQSFDAHKPIIVTAIDYPTHRSDFLERCIVYDFVPFEEKNRTAETELNKHFALIKSSLLGGILTLLSKVLMIYGKQKISKLPTRMGTYYQFGLALEELLDLPSDTFDSALKNNQNRVSKHHLSTDDLVNSILDYLRGRRTVDNPYPEIINTPSAILEELKNLSLNPSILPKTAAGFSNHLNRISKYLKVIGITINRRRTATDRKIIISCNNITFPDDRESISFPIIPTHFNK